MLVSFRDWAGNVSNFPREVTETALARLVPPSRAREDKFSAREFLKRLPLRPRSAHRTRSPVAVSQKREYFKYSPETIGDLSLEVAKFGVWRPTTNLQKPAVGGQICDY
jgi:hypothetical protein